MQAIHTGAPLTANIAKKVEAEKRKAGADPATAAPQSTEDRASPAPVADAEDPEIAAPVQEMSSPARPKSRSSFISMLLPGQGAAATESERVESPARPKSRSSFMSMILPTSMMPGGGASASGTERVSSPPRSGKNSPEKPSGAAAGSSSSKTPTVSPSKNSSAPSPSKVAAPPSKGKEKSASKLFGGPAQKAAAVKPKEKKEKKENKYDTDLHPSKLSDEAPRGSVGKPERPTITAEERKMLNLILSGNENVGVPALALRSPITYCDDRNMHITSKYRCQCMTPICWFCSNCARRQNGTKQFDPLLIQFIVVINSNI
jgi:hypothetical protein